MGAFSIWHWLIVLGIVVLVFGTKKLRHLGGDLGSALKGFKEGIKDSETENTPPPSTQVKGQAIEGEVKEKTETVNTASSQSPLHNQTIDAEVKKEIKVVNIAFSPPQANNQTVASEAREKIETKV